MFGTYKYIKDHGAMYEADYPYTARDGTCKHDSSKVIGHISNYGKSGAYNVPKMKEIIKMQPGAIAVDASSPQFKLYRSGTLKSCDYNKLNHAMVAVGYHDGTRSSKVRNC